MFGECHECESHRNGPTAATCPARSRTASLSRASTRGRNPKRRRRLPEPVFTGYGSGILRRHPAAFADPGARYGRVPGPPAAETKADPSPAGGGSASLCQSDPDDQLPLEVLAGEPPSTAQVHRPGTGSSASAARSVRHQHGSKKSKRQSPRTRTPLSEHHDVVDIDAPVSAVTSRSRTGLDARRRLLQRRATHLESQAERHRLCDRVRGTELTTVGMPSHLAQSRRGILRRVRQAATTARMSQPKDRPTIATPSRRSRRTAHMEANADRTSAMSPRPTTAE